MASKPVEYSDNPEGSPNVNLFRLIVTQSPDVLQELKHAHKSRVGNATCLADHCCFWYYTPPTTADGCDCWYALEYYDFINGEEINIDMLNTVLNNLRHGSCPHVVEYEQNGGDVSGCRRQASTTLMHAAAAVGHVQVVKFLRDKYLKLVYKSTLQRRMRPLHLALIKSQGKVVKYLHCGKKQIHVSERHFLFDNLELATRDLTSGKVSTVSCPVQQNVSNLAYILKLYNITDSKLVGKAINIGNFGSNMDYIIAYFLLTNDEDRAMSILTNKHVDLYVLENLPLAFDMTATACVLTDSDTCLKFLIKKHRPTKYSTHGSQLIDITKICGSPKCLSILQPLMTPAKDTWFSPFMFLFLIAKKLDMNTETMQLLVQRCKRQGFDINHVDKRYECSALALAVSKNLPQIVKALLEEGSDVDTVYKDKTMLCTALVGKRDMCGNSPLFYRDKKQVLDIIRHNPSPRKQYDALELAWEYDLATDSDLAEVLSAKDNDGESEQTYESSSDVRTTTSTDTFLSASVVAILYELGFPVTESCMRLGKYHRTRTHTALALYNYAMTVTSCPRSLRSSCRIALRKTFPGNRLHAYLSTIDAPHPVVDFVIRPWFLRSD